MLYVDISILRSMAEDILDPLLSVIGLVLLFVIARQVKEAQDVSARSPRDS